MPTPLPGFVRLRTFVLLPFAFPLTSFAQACHVDHGPAPVLLYGELTDPSGASVAGAQLTVTCGAEQLTAATDKTGHYALRVSPGQWNLTLSASGFGQIERSLPIAPGSDLQVNFPLQVSSGQEHVDVRAGAEGYVATESDLATRTNTSLMEVPQAVYVVPQAVLRDQQVVRLTDAIRNVSGVSFASDSGGRNETIVMRGFTSGFLFKDGFRSDGASTRTWAELSNVDRVEILKGPSSTVFGRLDPSGVVNLVTKQPLPAPQISVQMQGGSYQFLRPTVDITGPLTRSGRLLGRFIASGQDSKSFRDFNVTRRLFVSPTLTWTPTRSTSVRIYSEFLGGSGILDRGIIALGTRPANLPISLFLADPSVIAPYREGKAGISLDQALPHGITFRSYQRSATGFAINNARNADSLLSDNRTLRLNDIYAEQYTQAHYWINEATGTAHTGALHHTLLGGVELNYEILDNRTLRDPNRSQLRLDIYNPNYAAIPTRTLTLNRIDQSRNGFGGVYVQDQVQLGRKLTFTAGIRYDVAKLKTVGYFNQASSSGRNTAWSPRLGLSYRPIEAIAFYATWSRSFLPQSGLDFNGNPFTPERGKLLEAGLKYDTLQHRASGTVSVYQVDKQNVLTTDPANTTYQIQVGGQRSRGIEWNQTTRIVGGFNLINGYAFNQGKVSRDNVYLVGAGLIAAPRHTGNFWLQYQPHDGWASHASLGAGIFGASKSEGELRTQAAPGTYFLLPGYARFDLATSYELPRHGAWSTRFALNVNNVLDRRFFSGSGGRMSVTPGAPRSLVLSLQLLHIGDKR